MVAQRTGFPTAPQPHTSDFNPFAGGPVQDRYRRDPAAPMGTARGAQVGPHRSTTTTGDNSPAEAATALPRWHGTRGIGPMLPHPSMTRDCAKAGRGRRLTRRSMAEAMDPALATPRRPAHLRTGTRRRLGARGTSDWRTPAAAFLPPRRPTWTAGVIGITCSAVGRRSVRPRLATVATPMSLDQAPTRALTMLRRLLARHHPPGQRPGRHHPSWNRHGARTLTPYQSWWQLPTTKVGSPFAVVALEEKGGGERGVVGLGFRIAVVVVGCCQMGVLGV